MMEVKVIENKATDGVTIKEKRGAWQRIADTFNSQALQHRDVNTLKLKYENIKRNLKKKIADEKLGVKATGGGPFTDIKLLWYEEQLYSVLQLGISGLPSQGDCDSVLTPDSNDSVSNNVEEIIIVHGDSNVLYPNMETVNNNKENELLGIVQGQQAGTSQFTPYTVRRPLKRKRPLSLSKQKETTTESFNALAKIKMEVSQLQKEVIQQEISHKEVLQEQAYKESCIKQKILQMEYETKKAALEHLTAEKIHTQNMFRLMEEEQNLKIEILKCELHSKLKHNN